MARSVSGRERRWRRNRRRTLSAALALRRRYVSSGSRCAVPIASSAHVTSWAARARCIVGALASSSSACASMIPSWLFNRWNSTRSSAVIHGDCGRSGALASASRRPPLAWMPAVGRVAPGRGRAVGLTPQRVDEDADAAAGGADVLHLARRNPVVDGATAHADQLARLHDSDRLTFHIRCPSSLVSAVHRTGSRRGCIGSGASTRFGGRFAS